MPYGSHASEAQLRWKAVTGITDERLPVIFPSFIRPQYGSNETVATRTAWQDVVNGRASMS